VNLSCPRCKRAEISALAVDEEQNLQRFQCRSCGENFTGPALPQASSPEGSQQRVESPQAPALPGFAHVPIAAPEPSDVRVLEDQPVGKCEKCGKPYYRLGKRFEEHVRDCKGGPYVVFRRRAPRAGGSAPTGTPAPVTVAQLLPVAMPAGTGKALDISIEALKVQRSVLEAEIGELNRTIMTLEKLKGLGGVSSVPFTPPAELQKSPPEAPPGVSPAETPSETLSAPAGA
jgi:hypothetical protein